MEALMTAVMEKQQHPHIEAREDIGRLPRYLQTSPSRLVSLVPEE